MPQFTLEANTRYRATIHLGVFQQVASNADVAKRLASAGFKDVNVLGEGRTRIATGTWFAQTQTVDLPEQVIDVCPA